MFQKIKYVYDWDKKSFKIIEFPIDKWTSQYLQSKGFQDDQEIALAEFDYGKNQLDMVRIFLINLMLKAVCHLFFQ